MKKGLLIAFAILMLSSYAWAGAPYVGIFATDVDESQDPHSLCSVSPALYEEFFIMWVWVLPTPKGMQAYEFKLLMPSPSKLVMAVDDYPPGEVWNPDITIQTGSWNVEGNKGAFGICMYDWTWVYKRWYYSTATTPRVIQVAPHTDSSHPGQIVVANCDPGYPLNDATALTHLYLYQPCVYATQESTWGAIKSMF